MSKEGLVVGLDVGSSKVTIVVGEATENNEIYILGSGTAQSAGIKKGMIVNIEETMLAIESVVSDAEHIADVDIDTVYLGVGGYHIEGQNTRGRIIIPSTQKEIALSDKQKVQEAARAVPLEPNHEILHVIAQEYKVDDQNGIIDPVGMAGSQLEVETHIITGATTSIRNLQKSVRGAGLKVKEMLFEGLASCEAVLTPDEKELGVALVDIGAGTTDIVIYSGGYVKHSNVLPIGSAHLTSDISICLRTSVQEAERLKTRHGFVWSEGVNLEEKISVANAGNDGSRQIEIKQLFEIVEPRFEEIFTMIQKEIRESGYYSTIPAGLVMTGGGSLLTGARKFAEKFLGMPARLGKPANITGLTEKVSGPGFSTCIGLLAHGLRREHNPRYIFAQQSGFLDGAVSWIKNFFKDIF